MSFMEQNGFMPIEAYENFKHSRVLDPRELGRDALVLMYFKAVNAPRHIGTWTQCASVQRVHETVSGVSQVEFALHNGDAQARATGKMFDGFWNADARGNLQLMTTDEQTGLKYRVTNGFIRQDSGLYRPSQHVTEAIQDSRELVGSV